MNDTQYCINYNNESKIMSILYIYIYIYRYNLKMNCNNIGDVTDTSVNNNKISLYVADSKIMCAGKGLFTNKFIKEESYICEYMGPNGQKEYPPYREFTIIEKNYIVQNHDNTVRIIGIDRNERKTCCASWINDPLHSCDWNVEMRWNGTSCKIFSTSDIEEKQELLIPYDGSYWIQGNQPYWIIQKAYNCYGIPSNMEAFQKGISIAARRQNLPVDMIPILYMQGDMNSEDEDNNEDEIEEVEITQTHIHEIIDLTKDTEEDDLDRFINRTVNEFLQVDRGESKTEIINTTDNIREINQIDNNNLQYDTADEYIRRINELAEKIEQNPNYIPPPNSLQMPSNITEYFLIVFHSHPW